VFRHNLPKPPTPLPYLAHAPINLGPPRSESARCSVRPTTPSRCASSLRGDGQTSEERQAGVLKTGVCQGRARAPRTSSHISPAAGRGDPRGRDAAYASSLDRLPNRPGRRGLEDIQLRLRHTKTETRRPRTRVSGVWIERHGEDRPHRGGLSGLFFRRPGAGQLVSAIRLNARQERGHSERGMSYQVLGTSTGSRSRSLPPLPAPMTLYLRLSRQWSTADPFPTCSSLYPRNSRIR